MVIMYVIVGLFELNPYVYYTESSDLLGSYVLINQINSIYIRQKAKYIRENTINTIDKRFNLDNIDKLKRQNILLFYLLKNHNLRIE